MGKIKAVIFDLEGTLIRTSMPYFKSIIYKTIDMMEEGKKPDEHGVCKFIFGRDRNEIIKKGFKIENVRRFWRVYNRLDSVESRLANSSVYSDVNYLDDLNMSYGVVASVRPVVGKVEVRLVRHSLDLKYISLVNNYRDRTNIDGVIASLSKCMKEFEVKASEVMYVGDTKSDIIPASKLEMMTVLLKRTSCTGIIRGEFCTYIVGNLGDISEIVENENK